MDDQLSTAHRFQEIEASGELIEYTRELAHQMSLAPGDLFWKRKDGRLYRLYQAGDPVEEKKIEKFFLEGQPLYYYPVVDLAYIKTLNLYFGEYLQADNERLRISYRDRFFASLKPVYWDGVLGKSWLNLCVCFHQNLYRKEMDELSLQSNPDHYRRATLVGVLAVLGGMSLGYHQRDYLKDLFQLPYFLGVSLHQQMTTSLHQVMDAERQSREKFQAQMAKLEPQEKKALKEHAQKDVELVQEKYGALFTHQSVIRMLGWQHERALGNGFPLKIGQDELSDIELWVSYTTRLFPEQSFEFDRYDGRSGIQNYFETYRKQKDDFFFMGRRVFQLIEGLWNSPQITSLGEV